MRSKLFFRITKSSSKRKKTQMRNRSKQNLHNFFRRYIKVENPYMNPQIIIKKIPSYRNTK